ncbi:xylulokinase [Pelagovum pacificum]|uniref:Xylulose kinase n=1 Tax=Pelagovum pacificum TaxID=2588711 RepID=A0A5C5GDC1_9RHOB|nr:xylulokinase [Pelagovum pacificum]QQA44373.1 xylulokinase [Pelagovum pacificum]TNY32510.1 xylulokinase [Pelagovum pacificum]
MFIGLDLGTSGLKALVMDDDQKILGEATAEMTVSRPKDGWSEQDPAQWIAACEAVFEALKGKVDLSGVKGIGLSGQMHGATLIDAADQVLRPCILWNDTRSHEEAAALDSEPLFRDLTGNIVFPGFTAPKLAWVRNNEPEIFAKVAKVLLPKDYLRLWLSGDYVAEMSDAAGTSWLDTGKRDWSDELLARTDLSRDHMPRLVEGSEVSATLRDELADKWGLPKGVVIAGGGGDNAASGVGVGVAKAGEAFVSLGTSGVLFAASDAYQPDAATAVHTFCHALPGTWHQMGVILAAADALNWYSKLAGEPAADLTGRLGTLQAPGRTLFLPYLGGERTPHNDARVRAQFLNLDHASDRDSLTRAVLEGVTFAIRDSFVALTATGTKMERLIAVGGGTRSDYWLKAIATALNMPVELPVSGDFGGAFGAARLALMAATGAGAEVASAPPIDRTVEPDSTLTDDFAEAHERYRAAYQAVKGL